MAQRWVAAGAVASLVLVPWMALAQGAGRQKLPPWQLEKTPELIRLSRTSDLVDYRGAGRYYSPLVFECVLASKTMTARLESAVKTSGSFTVRFDQEPARTYPGRPNPEWQTGARQAYLLRIPQDAMAQFLNDARTSKRLMFRHEFGGIPSDVHYDLVGLEKEIAPLLEACGIGAATPRAEAASTAKAPRPSPKPDRQIGPWLVRESVSTVDDKLIVVVSGVDKLQKVEMYVRCRESQVEAFFVQRTSVFMADKDEEVTVDVAVDGGEPVRHKGPTTPLYKAAFVNDGRAFVASLAGKKAMTLTYTPWHKAGLPDVVKTASFSLAGLDPALEPVLQACPAGTD
jgi:hypothetical protein